MIDDVPHPSDSPVSRRALIGGLAAGAGALGLGLTARPAAAAGSTALRSPAGDVVANAVATPLDPGLVYEVYPSWQFQPTDSTQGWLALNGSFRFATLISGGGLAAVHPRLPVGTVVHEWEVYGATGLNSSAALHVWTQDVTTGAYQLVGSRSIAGSQSSFTATLVLDPPVEITTSTTLTPFVLINDSVPGSTHLWGARLGYAPPPAAAPSPAFVALDPIPRPYNTRDTAGLTKLNPGEERTITLPVPAGISAAVVQLTVTETGTGGFVGVFPADAAGWPGNSSINWSAVNQNVGGTVITAVSSDGKIKLRGGGSPTHVIIDVPGYLT